MFHEAWRGHEDVPIFASDDKISKVIVGLIQRLPGFPHDAKTEIKEAFIMTQLTNPDETSIVKDSPFGTTTKIKRKRQDCKINRAILQVMRGDTAIELIRPSAEIPQMEEK